MIYRCCCLSLLLSIAACGKKDENKAAPSAAPAGSAAAPAGSAAAPAPTPPAAAKAQYTCDELIPASVREKYLKDRKITDGKPGNQYSTDCNIADGDNPEAGKVSSQCIPGMVEQKEIAIQGIKKVFKDAKDVTDIGRGGTLVEIAGSKQYSVFDDNSDCQLIVQAGFDVDLAAMTKDIVAAFPPK